MFLFSLIDKIKELKVRVSFLEKEVKCLKFEHEKNLQIIRSNFARIKSHQEISQLMIAGEVSYFDLSPIKAIEIYRNQDNDFIILDVTESDNRGDIELEGTVHIPFSQLPFRLHEIDNKFTPLMVISKKGVKSILACELLAQKGFHNINNVSGGFMLWGRSENSLFKIAL